MGAGFIKDSDWVYFTAEGHQKNSKSILRENDLLIVRSGAPGTACVVTEDYVGCNAIDIIIAHPDCEKVNPYYLCTFTNMPHGKKQIVEGTGGAAQQHFNVGKYNKLQLMLPPKELQDKFVEFINQIAKSKKQIVEGTGGAAQQHFNVGKYNKLQLMLPPKELQDKFVEFINQIAKSKFTKTFGPLRC